MHPNQLFAAGSIEADMQSEENTQRRLFIESDEKAANGVVPFYPDFGRTDIDGNGSTEDYIRIDDTITGLQGVLTYSYNEYRLIAQNTITSTDLIRNQLRTDAPVLEKGDLRIATFNVLNYFNSPFGGSDNQFGSNRGAKTEPEFLIQEAKIVNAIISLDADIVGLMEIENNGFSNEGAIQQLVNKINAGLSNTDKHYRFVSIDSNKDNAINELDSVGTDSIAVGVIYRESAVENTNNQVIQMPSQQAPQVLDEDGDVIESGINYQRDAIASTFRVLGGNKLLTVAVNHFKSKGSKCWEDAAPEADGGQAGNDPDQQGSCERFRVAAADALGKALNEIEGHTLILGDLNSYAKEDAILILTDYSEELYGKEIFAARDTFIGDTEQYPDTNVDDINKLKITTNYGYINAVEKVHPINWSYSYNDEVGSLDYILVSESLKNRIVDATDWHINAAESTLLDYNTQYKGDLPSYSDQFRSSDHDPAIVELQIYARDSGTDDGNKPDKDAGSIQTFILLLLSFLALIRVRKSRK
jgi:predicted extracellular nuclease